MKYIESFKTIKYSDMTSWGSDKPMPPPRKPLDKEYMNSIFIDFIDDNVAEILEQDSEYEYEIRIDDILHISYTRDIEKFVESTENLNKFALELKSCVDRVKDEYPDIEVSFYEGKGKGAYYELYFNNKEK